MSNNKTFAVITIVALLSGACGSASTPATGISPTTPSPESIGTVIAEKTLVESGPSDELIQVADRQDFFNNDNVRVTKGGVANLNLLDDQILIRVFNDTSLENIKADPSGTPDPAVRMKLVFGGVMGEVTKNGIPAHFEISNGVNIYILGTQFLILYDPGTSTTYIGNFDGAVAFTTPAQQSVQFIPAGQINEISPGFATRTMVMNFTRADLESLMSNTGSTLLIALRELLESTPTPVPTPTLTESRTPTPTPTLLPTTTPTSTKITLCDQAAFVMDVTVPDGTPFTPGFQFTKVWRLRNVGTCTWTNGYSLAFSRGEQMSGPVSVNLPSSVAPGQTVDIPVSLVAPRFPGLYRGEWLLRNASGASFGVGANGTGPIWVTINVIPDTITVTAGSPGRIIGRVRANSESLSGFSVRLFDSSGNTMIATTVTDTSGIYIFPNLSAGAYFVKWTGEDCSGKDAPGETQVKVNAGETQTQDIDVTVLC